MSSLRTLLRTPLGILVAATLVATGLRLADANPALAQTRTVTAWQVAEDPGLDPTGPVWAELEPVPVPLTAQTVATPIGGGSVSMVWVSAAHHDGHLYLRMEWVDVTTNTDSARPEDFADAAAVQLPGRAAASVPAVCMGQADQAVNIWQWRADNQVADLEAPPTEHGYVDRYDSTEDLFYPAREAGNPLALPGAGPVENLVAGGFGTLASLEHQIVEGMGVHSGGSWAVVFRRAFASPGEGQPSFAEGDLTDVAFAVWDGERGDRDGQKSVSAYARLHLSAQPPPPVVEPPVGPPGQGIVWALIVGFGLLLLALSVIGLKSLLTASRSDA